jgi:hypothetical protein
MHRSPAACQPGRLRADGLGLTWVTLLALLCLAAPALARRGPVSGGERAALLQKARPLLDKAIAAMAIGDLPAAARALDSAYRSAPVPEVLLQLARLAQAEKRPVDTYDLYRRYAADPTRIPDEAAQREAETVLAAPQPPSGSLTINGPPSALVVVDGRPVGVLPLPQPLLLAPADHTLVLDLGNKRLDTPLPIAEGRLCEVRTSRTGALLISVLPALLVLDEWPGVASESLRPFNEAIERAAIVQQMGVMPRAVALQKAADLESCLGTLSCQQQLARRSGLDYLLRSRVARSPAAGAASPAATPTASPAASPTASWTLELNLYHVAVADPASSAQVTCEACTIEQAVARYRDALTDVLGRGLPRQFGTARISSFPAGATVAVGGHELGKAPLEVSLWEGQYELTLTHEGRKPARSQLAIAASQQIQVSVPLEPATEGDETAPPPAPSPTAVPASGRLPRPRWRLATGGAVLSFGAVLLTVGTGLLYLYKNPDACYPTPPTPPGAACKYYYDTQTSGSVTTAFGLAAGIAGGILLSLPGPRRN